jgi:hypothetical protein
LRVSIAPAIALAALASALLIGWSRPASAVEYGTVNLAWTAPGDDSLVGTATAYDLRYFTIPINLGNFFSATKVSPGPTPLSAGKAQSTTVHGLVPGAWYYFAIRTVDDVGNWSGISNIVRVQASYPLGVGDATELSFSNPYPNPSRASASFSIGLPAASAVDIEAFDVTGRHVRTLMNSSEQQAGHQTLVWDLRDDGGRPLGSGMYLVRARVGGQTFIRRVTVGR